MSTMCFAYPGQNLKQVVNREYGIQDAASFEERIRAIEALNPRLPVEGVISDYQAIRLPGNEHQLTPAHDSGNTINCINQSSLECRKILADLGDEEQFHTFAAISEFVENYNLWSLTGDLNTYGGAGLANAVTHSDKLYRLIDNIDKHLVELRNTPKAAQAPIVAKINSLYKQLQVRFGTEIDKVLAQNYKGRKGHPLQSSERAIRMARGGSHQLPLTSSKTVQQMTKFATIGRYVGRGLIVADLGFRFRTVKNAYYNGNDWRRVAFSQAAGFGISFYVGGIAFSLLLGPFGVVIALIFAGVAAVAVDYAGQMFGNTVYDSGTWMASYLQPPNVY